MQRIQSLTHNSCVWGLHWLVLAAIAWGICCERNGEIKKGRSTPKGIILNNCLRMVNVNLKEVKFKKPHKTSTEALPVVKWDAFMMTLSSTDNDHRWHYFIFSFCFVFFFNLACFTCCELLVYAIKSSLPKKKGKNFVKRLIL